jgi:homocysteine S-methyltransferase
MEMGIVETSSRLMTDFLQKCGGYAVVDGGFATELERHGADLNDPLWSAKCLISSPHLVRKVTLSHPLSIFGCISLCRLINCFVFLFL